MESSGAFARKILSAAQQSIAQDFFRPSQRDGASINGHPLEPGPTTGAPLLTELSAWVECRLVEHLTRKYHAVFVAEVVEASIKDGKARALNMWTTGWFYAG